MPAAARPHAIDQHTAHAREWFTPAAIVVGDEQMRLKEWFGTYPGAVAVIRPDRFVAGLAYPVKINELLAQIADKMGLNVAKGAA